MERFHSVTVRMAKRQNLSLNPAKISGMCSRLMCCLAYEVDQYPAPERQRRDGG
jgi:cell fate regulator YaaT (PSP1 superfamily)